MKYCTNIFFKNKKKHTFFSGKKFEDLKKIEYRRVFIPLVENKHGYRVSEVSEVSGIYFKRERMEEVEKEEKNI